MASPSMPRRASGEVKKTTVSSSVSGAGPVTRNGARKAKIQTRAMSSGAKPSAALLAAKKKASLKKKQMFDTVLRDHYQTVMESKHVTRGETGLVTDPKMILHKCLWDSSYPECPERLTSIIDRCQELGLIDCCKKIPPRKATKEELLTLHAESVFEWLEKTDKSEDTAMLEEVSSKYDAIYVHPTTHELALLAAGSTIELVDRVVRKELQNGMALVRPPGHHAMTAEPCGYCFYNNVALAAKHAVDNLGITRVLVVDWDVHHGQATQQMFYNDPRVVYFSVHRYEHGTFWPNLRQSDFHYTGSGRGAGYNFNVPLNQTKMQDADYLAIWQQLLLPMALEYQPELVIVSAGYDAALGCPEGEMEVTPACYAHLTHMLSGVSPALCVVLEGGYHLRSLSESAALTLATLLGRPPPRLQTTLTPPCDSIKESILNCIYAHKAYWRCYNFQPTYSTDTSVPNVSDVTKLKHTVSVKWLGDETRSDTFATRDCYPIQSQRFLDDVQRRLDHLRILTDLKLPEHRVCYVYDELMLKHKNICEPDHVECPARISRIHDRHSEYGLLERLHRIQGRRATHEEIALVHTETHIKLLEDMANTKLRDLHSQKKAYDSVYFHPDSYESAATATGCVLQMVDSIVSGEGGSGVCVVRPPGHHADEDLPSGFCLFNNAAIAAKYAITYHGLKRILLLDWDVHHGNGTQHIFEKDPRVLYMSLHRYDNGTFFPHSTDANYTSLGRGEGEGYNVNVAWNKRGMGDVEYLSAFTQVVLPIAYQYDPELVIVSAGFDACVGDPLGGCKVSPECYGRLTHWLRGLAGGRTLLCLEGGYNVRSISYAMTSCTKALLGDPLLHHYEPRAICHPSAVESINNTISVHKNHWKSLSFQIALPKEDVLPKPEPSRGLTIEEGVEDERKSTADGNRSMESMCYDTSGISSLNDSSKTDTTFNSTNESIGDMRLGTGDILDDGIANLSIGMGRKTLSKDISTDMSVSGSLKDLQNSSALGKCRLDKPGYESALVSPNKQRLSNLDRRSGNSKSMSEKCQDGNCDTSDEDEQKDGVPRKLSTRLLKVEKGGGSSAFVGGSSDAGSSSMTGSLPVAGCSSIAGTTPFAGTSSIAGSSSVPGTLQNAAASEEEIEVQPKTLTDFLAENSEALYKEEMYAVVPLSWCPHLVQLSAIPPALRLTPAPPCDKCQHDYENWLCLHCYVTACARYINGHMQEHFMESGHALVLSLVDLSVWCNACSAYVDHRLLYEAKNRLHLDKFGEAMPYCYTDQDTDAPVLHMN